MNPMSTPTEKRVYRFDEFRADSVRRVLLRDGDPVVITPKSFSILLVLLERRGEVVAKEDLIRRVWATAYVSDANLTQNISSLRKALGDRNGDRRYVVTVPGQGYSFTAPVIEETEDGSTTSGFFQAPEIVLPAEPTSEPGGRRAVRDGVVRRFLIGLVCLAAVAGLAFYLDYLRRGPLSVTDDLGSFVPPRRPSVAVLGFRDLSGSSGSGVGTATQWLGPALSEMLTTELSAGTQVRVVSQSNVARARLAIPLSGVLEERDLERIRSILGSDLLVIGTYLALDEGGERRIRLDVRVVEAPGGDTVASLAEVGKESALFELVSSVGARLRQALGLSQVSPQQAQAVRALQPAAPGALRFYTEGLKRLRAGDAPSALEQLRQGVEADPRSAVLRSALSEAYGALGYDDQALAEAKEAVALARSLPSEQRLVIQARLHELGGDWTRAGETYRSLWTFYPDDLEYGLKLANSLMRGGRTGAARDTVRALHRLSAPEGEDPRIDLLESRIAYRLADPAGELRAAEAALAKGRRSGETLIVAQALLSQGNAWQALGSIDKALAAFREALALAAADGDPMTIGMSQASLGLALQRQGNLDEAEKVQRETLDIARRIGSRLGITTQLRLLGDLHFARGDLDEALDFERQSLDGFVLIGDRVREGQVRSLIGLMLWARGDLAEARLSLDKALTLARETGDRSTEAASLSQIGLVLESQGDLPGALRRHEAASALQRGLGDRMREARILEGAARSLARLGDLGTARERLDQVLEIRRKLGYRLYIAEALAGLADLELRRGDLGAARRRLDEQMKIARDTRVGPALAAALRGAGRLAMAEDRLPETRRHLERALAAAHTPSLAATEIRLDLARLSLAEGRFEDAALLAASIADWCRERGLRDAETDALSIQADARLRQGRLADAQSAAERARVRAKESSDLELKLLVAARLARVDGAGGKGDALGALREELAAARTAGLMNAALQAQLAVGELLVAGGDAPGGRQALTAVRDEARARGLAGLAREAGQILDTGGVLRTLLQRPERSRPSSPSSQRASSP